MMKKPIYTLIHLDNFHMKTHNFDDSFKILPFLSRHQFHFYRKIAFSRDLSLRIDIHTKKK